MNKYTKMLVISSMLTITACTPPSRTISDEDGELPLIEYTVQGHPLQCVKRGAYKMSCNWERWNKTKHLCEAASLKRRTVTTKEGEVLVFPATKGECGDE